jgi:hypothetical protein
MTLSRQQIMVSGFVAAALTAVALGAANFLSTETSENGGGIEYAVTLGGSIVLALVLFGWLIPRTERPGRAGLVTGVIGVLSLAAFWSGAPYVLGPAAVVLGLVARSRESERGQGAAAAVLGALVTVAAIAAVVVDQTL